MVGSRREFITQAGSAASARQERPNILIIMPDDHPNNALSCRGSTVNQAPNLDRATGKYPHNNGQVTIPRTSLSDTRDMNALHAVQAAVSPSMVLGAAAVTLNITDPSS